MLVMLCVSSRGWAGALDQALQTQRQRHTQAKIVQQEIDALDKKNQQLLHEYVQVMQQINQLQDHRQVLQGYLLDQEKKLDHLHQQLERHADLLQKLPGLQRQMVSTLQSLLKVDMPFLQAERERALQQLQTQSEDSEISLVEQFEQVLTAYQREWQYSHENHVESISLDWQGQKQQVKTLRMGRVLYWAVSAESGKGWYWSRESRQWQALQGSPREIQEAIAALSDKFTTQRYLLPVEFGKMQVGQ